MISGKSLRCLHHQFPLLPSGCNRSTYVTPASLLGYTSLSGIAIHQLLLTKPAVIFEISSPHPHPIYQHVLSVLFLSTFQTSRLWSRWGPSRDAAALGSRAAGGSSFLPLAVDGNPDSGRPTLRRQTVLVKYSSKVNFLCTSSAHFCSPKRPPFHQKYVGEGHARILGKGCVGCSLKAEMQIREEEGDLTGH